LYTVFKGYEREK